jgi:hypothetical protein
MRIACKLRKEDKISFYFINSLKPASQYIYRLFNILKLCILSIECVCVVHMVLAVNSYCFPKQH